MKPATPAPAMLVSDVRARLSALGFDAPLTAESVGLVSSLLDALILERDKSRGLSATAEAQAQALFTAEKTGPPLRREIARLLRENIRLHSEMIGTSERAEAALKEEDLAAATLRGKARDLTFLVSNLRSRVQALERENAGLREAASRSFEINGVVLPSGHEVRWHGRKERMEAHSPVEPAPPEAALLARRSVAVDEGERLVPAAEPAPRPRRRGQLCHASARRDPRGAQLRARRQTGRGARSGQTREAAVTQLSEQLAAALEAGPPAEARRVEQQAHAAVVAQLNSQVDFLNTRCHQLEQALLHEQGTSRARALDESERRQYAEAIEELRQEKQRLHQELQRAAQVTNILGRGVLGGVNTSRVLAAQWSIAPLRISRRLLQP